MSEKSGRKKSVHSVSKTVFTVLEILIFIIFVPLLFLNTILLIKGAVNSKEPPSAFGYVFAVPYNEGQRDLLLIKKKDFEKLYIEKKSEPGFSVNDLPEALTQRSVKISNAGNFVDFIQRPKGLLVCFGIPLAVFAVCDTVRRRMLLKEEEIKKDQLSQEIEELEENPNRVDLPREVLKEPYSEVRVAVKAEASKDKTEFDGTQSGPAPERMAESEIQETKKTENFNNAEEKGSNEPSPQKVKVKIRSYGDTEKIRKIKAVKAEPRK